ncbi:UNVERIFIED_CONTAM: hypothetical protein PYX00_004766 [Menopon gallinae]|uniref:Uncharacterized protein n=1 Tax=Menopon gallinae TaxID=328185 RepID=A0AAW2I5I9_9NEOP
MSESVLTCAKRNLYRGLLNNIDSECIDIGDGVTFTAEADQVISPREIFPLGEEPATFRGVIDAYSTFLSRRAARWDLGFLYPGLVMRIGPTMDSAGVLEFALEKRLDYSDRSKLRPGQLIVRRTILPQLLGFRMNLASLLPVILGVLLFVSKNAFVFSKLTLVLSTLLALKSLFLMQQMRPQPTETYDVVETGSKYPAGLSEGGGRDRE